MHQLIAAAALLAAVPAPPDSAPPPRSLSGRVTTPAGAPLYQARVTVPEANRSTTTDLEGRYLVAELPSGTYSISFSAIGYAPEVRRVTLAGEDLTLDVELRPSMVELPDLQVTAAPVATVWKSARATAR